MKKSTNRANIMLIPLTIIFVILFVVPFIVLLYYSFLTYKSGQVIPTTPYTLGAYAKFFSDSLYPRVVGRTIVMGRDHCTYLFGTGISGCIFYFKK